MSLEKSSVVGVVVPFLNRQTQLRSISALPAAQRIVCQKLKYGPLLVVGIIVSIAHKFSLRRQTW